MQVLRAIVTDYVTTREAVGSRGIVERYNLGVSPATVRNDMAALEEAGYIFQPHTSAGRIPTELGYRQFVDQIEKLKPLSAPERRAIEDFMSGASDIDDVVDRTVRLLAQLTHQVAVVQYPKRQRNRLRHLELVPLTAQRLLMVVITDSGQVEQFVFEGEKPLDLDLVSALKVNLNARCLGLRPDQVQQALADLPQSLRPNQRELATQIIQALVNSLTESSQEKVVVAGTGNLARFEVDFTQSIVPVLDALEEQAVLLRLLAHAQEDGLSVSIGTENPSDKLSEASVVAGGYVDRSGGVSHLGVVGPTRMDYPAAMSAVYALSKYLTRFFGGEDPTETKKD